MFIGGIVIVGAGAGAAAVGVTPLVVVKALTTQLLLTPAATALTSQK